MTSPTFAIRTIKAFCYRYPLATPVVTSFGRMLDRPAVFVRVEDDDGHVGWGEAWANFPSVGAEHRTRLVNEVLAPAITGFAASHPRDVFETPDAGDLGAGAAIRRARAIRAGDRRDRSGGLGPLCAPPQVAAVEAARRQRQPDSGLRQRHQPDRLAANGGGRGEPRTSRAEAEGRLRPRGRPRQSGVASPADRRRHAGRRRQPGLVDGRRRWRLRRISASSVSHGWKNRSVPTGPGTNGRRCAREAHRRSQREKTSRAGQASSRRSAATCCGSFNPISRNGAA